MLTYIELSRVCDDLSHRLQRWKLQRVRQCSPLALALEFYGWDEAEESGSKSWLYLSVDPQNGRMHLLSESPESAPGAGNFASILKDRCIGARLAQLSLSARDRVVEIHLESRNAYSILILELIGNSSNLFLLDGERRILATLAPPKVSRLLRVGDPWTSPEAPLNLDKSKTDRFESAEADVLHQRIEAHYRELEASAEATDLRRTVSKELRNNAKGLRRSLKAVERDLDSHGDFEVARRDADLLKAYLREVPAGESRVVLTDYDDDGNELARTIALDPSRSPKQNMERYYKKYRKGKRAVEVLTPRIAELQEELDKLNAEIETIDDASVDELQAIAARYSIQLDAERDADLSAKASAQAQKPFASLPASMRPKVFTSLDGWEILVGKSARGNDELTTKIANGNDWFFHVAESPGSHVILRHQAGKTPPLETLLDCAHLALHFSKSKNAGRATVSYAQRKYVSKPKGAKAGLVIMNKRETLNLRNDPARLSRLLGRDLA